MNLSWYLLFKTPSTKYTVYVIRMISDSAFFCYQLQPALSSSPDCYLLVWSLSRTLSLLVALSVSRFLVYLLIHPNLVYRIFLAIDKPSSYSYEDLLLPELQSYRGIQR